MTVKRTTPATKLQTVLGGQSAAPALPLFFLPALNYGANNQCVMPLSDSSGRNRCPPVPVCERAGGTRSRLDASAVGRFSVHELSVSFSTSEHTTVLQDEHTPWLKFKYCDGGISRQ